MAEGKRAVMLIFEAQNSRYTGELKKDPEKIA